MTRDLLEQYIVEWQRMARVQRFEADPSLNAMREEALHRFLSLGFPTTREEEWRRTSVTPIAERRFTLAPAPAGVTDLEVAPLRLPPLPAAELVFVNGRYVAEYSRWGTLPPKVQVGSLIGRFRQDDVRSHLAHIAPFDRHPFVALNTAFLNDGVYVALAAKTIVHEPIHLMFVSTAGADGATLMSHPRALIVLGANSQASIVETYVGPTGAEYLTNAVTEIALGANAVLDHHRLQYEGRDAYHVGTVQVQAQRDATYASYSINLGGSLVRNDLVVVLDGEGGDCVLNGLYTVDAHRFVDNHTTIDHARAHCGSRETYKGILADHARGVFNGKIIVRPDAQKTDAKQTNRALLLSEDAQIDTKPQLEIFANDVKCTHGAAVGQLDEEALFYLRSRGLSDRQARRVLIHAFAADVLNRVPLEAVRAGAEDRLQRALAHALPVAA
jgi:Fe-S cluster assembly protein SufD